MAYEITAETPTEITLTPAVPPVGCLRWVLGGLGLAALLLGACLLLLRPERGADALNLTAGVFVVFGLLFLGLGLTMKARKVFGSGPGPAAFVFDQRRAGIWLRGTASDAAAATAALNPALLPAEAFLPFADITALRVAVQSHTSSNTTTTSSGRTTYSYHVTLDLHDGGTWTLTSDPDRDPAEAACLRLQTLVARAYAAAAAPAPPPPVLPAALTLARQGAVAQLRWRNPVPRAEVLRSLAGYGFLAGVLAVFGTIMRLEKDPAVFPLVVLVFIGSVFCWILVAQVRQWWRDCRRRYGLNLSPEAVAYVEEDAATGRETLRHALPRADYHGLSTDFDATGTDFNPTVRLLSHAAHAQLLHRRALALDADLPVIVGEALAKNLAQPMRLKTLGPAQRLALVQWVRTA